MQPVTYDFARSTFADSYRASRDRFLSKALEAGADVSTWTHPSELAPDGGALTTDVAMLGPRDAQKALLIVSGTHGPEGFAGAAAQVALLEELATAAKKPSVRVVLIHAINPWGIAHYSRTTENNVDLNRNFIDWSHSPPPNEAYVQLHSALCLTDSSEAAAAQSKAAIDAWVAIHGFEALTLFHWRGDRMECTRAVPHREQRKPARSGLSCYQTRQPGIQSTVIFFAFTIRL